MVAAKKGKKEGAKKRKELATLASGLLSKPASTMTVGVLERALLKEFPAADAASWDRTGLAVGDPAEPVAGVAVALDPTVDAIGAARERGANVLVTHHPAFLDPPGSFAPASSVAANPGAGVWAAIDQGVALMAFHTALDVSPAAASVLPGMLNLVRKGILDPLEGSPRKGYGQVCEVRAEDDPLTLGQLAARCTSVFGRQPRVWGDFGRDLVRVATWTGSAGGAGALCLRAQVDCLVCGEVKYHDALALSQAGLAIIELGHDTSELPLVAPLAAAVERAGVPKELIAVIDQGDNWSYPEAVRV